VTTERTEPETKEGRITRDLRLALQVGRQPSAVLPVLRRWLVKIWASRGGGFYGLGYLIAFVALEVRSLSVDLTSVSGVVAQAAQYLVRFSIESFINGISALLWPVYLFQWLGGLGVVVLVAGYAGFEFAIRPVMEALLPEIREAIAEKERRKQERKERKASKRA
jgi:hypothetical protein